MIMQLNRGQLEPWTPEDVDIVVVRLRIPSWLRAEYKYADRKDAESMFSMTDAALDERHFDSSNLNPGSIEIA